MSNKTTIWIEDAKLLSAKLSDDCDTVLSINSVNNSGMIETLLVPSKLSKVIRQGIIRELAAKVKTLEERDRLSGYDKP